MNDEDLDATIELAMEEVPWFQANADKTVESLRTKVGGTERQRRIEIGEQLNAVIFLGEMRRHNGTFVWEGPKQGRKFSTIFQGLAAAMEDFENKDWEDQYSYIKEYAPKLQAGFTAARKWLGKWYGDTVFSVPQINEATKPTVLTLDPDYMLKSGITAFEMQKKRDLKLAEGQLNASTRRVAGSVGKENALVWLDEVLKHARHELESFTPTRMIDNDQ